MTNIDNIWRCVRTANLRKMLKAGNGFEGIPCRKLAISIEQIFDDRFEGWVRTDEIVDKTLLEVTNHGQILKEIGVIIDDWKKGMESTIHDELLVNNGIYPEEWLVENGRDPEMGIGQALGWADTIRRQWELCEELRDRKLPEVCVWNMNGERYTGAKREA